MLTPFLTMKTTQTTRIARVKATGDMYVVQRLSLDGKNPANSRAFVWGEVTAYHTGRGYTRQEQLDTGASMTHAASKAFALDAVEIVEMLHDGHLAQKLLEQGRRAMGGITRTRQVRR